VNDDDDDDVVVAITINNSTKDRWTIIHLYTPSKWLQIEIFQLLLELRDG